MKLVTSTQMRGLDAAAIERIGIPGIVLMENASRGVFDVISANEHALRGKNALVVCGRGNNGGDGFAIARHLLNAGALPNVILAASPGKITGDALTNLNACRKLKIPVIAVPDEKGLAKIKSYAARAGFIVDALLGTGVAGELKPFFLKIINIINSSEKTVYAVDVPSGLIVDSGRVINGAVKATHTITFGAPKTGLFVHPGAAYAGQVYVVDIGIPSVFIEKIKADAHLTSPAYISTHVLPRKLDAHKGDCGRVLIIGGAKGMSGAPVLAGLSALRMGAGLVYLAVPEEIAEIVDKNLIEGVTLPLPDENGAVSPRGMDIILEKMKCADSVVLGPGISVSDSATEVVLSVIKRAVTPLIIDADALNCLASAGAEKALRAAKAPVIITPHPGEMGRLAGISTKLVQEERLATARECAKKFKSVVLLKGAGSIIASPDGETYINPTGNAGMATAGSGDVLSGITGALAGEGIQPFAAAVCGAFIHGMAGDTAAKSAGERALVAGDMIRALKKIVRDIEERNSSK